MADCTCLNPNCEGKASIEDIVAFVRRDTEFNTKEAIADWLVSISNEWIDAELLAGMIRAYEYKGRAIR